MRRLFLLFSLIAITFAAPADAKALRFPKTGAHVFRINLPKGWTSTIDKRGGLLLVAPDHHAMIYLAIVKDGQLRGAPERMVAAKVARVAGIVMGDKQEPERMAGPDGVVRYRGTAFYGTLPAKRGLRRHARIVVFRLAPTIWAQVWTVTQAGMNNLETAALAKVLNSVTLASR